METTLRYCPVCEIRTKRKANGECLRCEWWEALHLTPLGRNYVLVHLYDEHEYVPPVIYAEYLR